MPPSPKEAAPAPKENAPAPTTDSPDDVCITGIAGYFPNSYSVKHLADNLFNKVDMISDDDRRWTKAHPEIPQRTGKVYDIEKFDASFFDIDYKEAHTANPLARLVLERTYECLIDAGINPCELRNTKTGVFIGACVAENESMWVYKKPQKGAGVVKGILHSLASNTISHWLGLKGPSYTVDTACSSSLFALDHAYKSVRDGHCDAAIVAGINLCLLPSVSLTFYRMGILSDDGRCKSFDNRANGYARSESIVACFLQKAKDSRRVHAKLVHTKTNCDGYKMEGISYPAGCMQKVLLEHFYDECGVCPSTVEFLEAHATGTVVGDPEELGAIDDIFCKNRTEPLLIGSVKSNLGHSEGSSGMNSIAKACIAYNSGYIPPNINFESPRKECPSLMEGRLQVVTEKMPWNRGHLALSSFGFGGANAHVLLENFRKTQVNNGLPSDEIPRLVCVSGRTETAVAKILDDLESRPVNVNYVRLWHAIHEKDIFGHEFRGFIILDSSSTQNVSLVRKIECILDNPKQRPVVFKYTDLRDHWPAVARQCMILPAFVNTIQRCAAALKYQGMDLIRLYNEDVSRQREFAILGAASVYIGLTDVLKAAGIRPDHVVNFNVGEPYELCSAYAKNHITAEQVILAAYEISVNYKNKLAPENKRSASTLKEISSIFPNESAIVIEIGFNEGLSVYDDKSLKINDDTYISLIAKNKNHVETVLEAIGKLFLEGLNPSLANLYPPVAFPVAQGTPMMSHLVEWNHNDDWTVADFSDFFVTKVPFGQRTVKLYMEDERNDYLRGHTIDGRVLFPATGYLQLVWESLASMTNRLYSKTSVVFEEVYLQRSTNIPKDGILEFKITIHKESGKFEITENKMSIVTGRIRDMNYSQDESFTALETRHIRKNKDVNCEILTSRDFYKELNLRGYQYKGLFRGVRSCSVDGTHGQLSWHHNWITFLDTVLQVKIVSQDTRALYVPTRIEKIIIDTAKHSHLIAELEKKGGDMCLEFENIHEIDMTRAGGIEVRGIHVSSISKKPPRGIPVLERNQFIANFCPTQMTLSDILRCNIQLIHENIQTYKIKTIELVDEDYEANNILHISEEVADILADLPLVQAEVLVLCNDPITMPANITVANKKISGETNAVLFIGANLLKKETVLQEALTTLKEECFILSRENTYSYEHENPKYDIITVFYTEAEHFVLLRSKINTKLTKYLKIDSQDLNFSWIDDVKNELQKEQQTLVLYSENEPVNGLLGLVNCLRKETGGKMVRGLLISDPNAPTFTADSEFYKEHMQKGLALNVVKNGQWGTYRHTLLEELATIPAAHAYANTATIGDLNSLRYWEGRHSENQLPVACNKILVQVYCSALNFRDVMTAMGRVTVDSVARGRFAQECVQGLEVAGRTNNGIRVMGVGTKGLSNFMELSQSLVWPVPDEWSFQEAATVPVAYMTVYTAMVMIGKIRRGEKILIHAGSGGVGQAAINVAQHYGLEVFTTVGTPAKRDFIKRLFPQLKDSHIGNSRDTSFEDMIRRETNGEGVDVVLNSLAEEKLQASVKCLRRCGRFLEIGKYDITINTQIETCFLQKEISFHSVMLDYISEGGREVTKTLQNLFMQGIQSGAVRPLTNCSFDKYDIQTAYRYMAAGKHIGKVVIKMREEEPAGEFVIPKPELIDAVPRYMCNEELVYVLVGGLGGFGLELADWLVLRGARKLLISSSRGVSKGYQSLRIRIWKSYGVEIEISTHDVTTEAGCEEMLKMAAAMGPVTAIFNLAVVLNDAIFQNQTPETYRKSYGPKALATIYLDRLSRNYCPNLKDFVIFSSVSCGRGNAGQTNYGFSNSVMERICEERKKEGLPALAIQWGAIGDVGLVADMQEENVQLEIGGTLQQKITSCLQVLDKFLKQDVTIASSIVVAEKRSANAGADSIVDVIAHILGISDVKSISKQAPLSEMGMDSVMAVEIKQTLERDYELYLTAQEIRLLTFAKLTELLAKDSEAEVTTKTSSSVLSNAEITAAGLDMIIKKFGDENLVNEPYIIFNSNDNQLMHSKDENVLFMLPGIESCASSLETLCGQIKAKTCVLQLGLESYEDMESLVNRLYKTVKPALRPGAPYFLLGYSFGSLPMLKLAARLENEGHEGILFAIEGSPEYMKNLVNEYLKFSNDDELQNYIICHSIAITCSGVHENQIIINKLKDIKSFEDRIKCAKEMVPTKLSYSDEFMFSSAKAIFDRIKMIVNLDLNSLDRINAPIVLLRGQNIPLIQKCNETYGLDRFTAKTVSVHYIDANHSNITEKKECAEIINKIFNDYDEGNHIQRFIDVDINESANNRRELTCS